MDQKVQSILEKTAGYVEQAQTQLDANNEARIRFVKRASQAAGVLVQRGLLSRDAVDRFVDKVAADGCEVWDLVEKLAAAIQPEGLVDPVQEKLASGAELSAWDKLYYYGDARADVRRPGMVD
jgi:hypothetical protein